MGTTLKVYFMVSHIIVAVSMSCSLVNSILAGY